MTVAQSKVIDSLFFGCFVRQSLTKAVLGIIGGSGIYDLPGLTNGHSKIVESPWGKPSAALLMGEIAGLPIVFL